MRESGILMHISSLPGPYGLGTMGESAYRFVDFLEEAGQRVWQILPLSPTGFGDSPYQSCSAYAGNHYLIDLDTLIHQGLLEKWEVEQFPWFQRENKADFGLLYNSRLKVLRLAYSRFTPNEDFEKFCRDNGNWLADFALFMALKDRYNGAPWFSWEEKLKRRDPDAIWQARQELKGETAFYSFVQYLFFQQWNALRSYAHSKNISIIGDVPIYVPMDSCDVWSNPELFQLDENLDPVAVAGCPPDAFSADGQLWGNPLYRWDLMAQEGYNWWIRRLQAAGTMYDIVRFDHFRGFESYWSVPYGAPTAREGQWVKGPDMDFIQVVKDRLPHIRMIAEDLGFLTPEVLKMRDDSGFPGMKVLEFAFDSKEPSEYLPHTYTSNTVCYTGTHDNMTLAQWFQTNTPETNNYAASYMHLTQEEGYIWGVIRTAMSSVSDLCVVQMQDYLHLGGEARMNAPGLLTDANWTWRADPNYLNHDLANRIRYLTGLYGRMGDESQKQ